MKILINGSPHEIQGPNVTYEDVLRLAGRTMGASVVYYAPRHGDMRRRGTLYAGKSVMAEEGMVFSAVHAGNA